MNPATIELVESQKNLLEGLTHLKFAHGLNENPIHTDTIAFIIKDVSLAMDRLQDLINQETNP